MRRRRSSKVRYASASAEAKAWGIVVVDAGHAAVPPKSPCPPSRHPRDRHEIASGRVLSGFHFICVASGQGEFETKATGIRRLGAGDLVVLPPGIWHRYGPDFDSGWHLYWLEFDGDLARRWMSREEFREADPVVPIGACLPSFERVIDLLHSARPGGDLILGALAAEAIAEVLAAIKQGRGKARPVAMVIREARNLLAQGHADPGNMTEFAERRNLSYSVFRRWIKAETGCSPRQFIQQTKMN